MTRKILQRLALVILSALSIVIFSTVFSTVGSAQTDININDRNIIRFGEDVIVPANEELDNAYAFGGDVTLESGAHVTDTAIALGGDVILESDARIDGDAYAIGGEVITADGAIVGGESGVLAQEWGWRMARNRGWNGFGLYYLSSLASHVLLTLISAGIGVLLMRWRPGFLPSLAETVRQFPLQSIFWGLGGIVAAIGLVILLAISIIGILLLPPISVIITASVWVGSLGIALWLGEKIWSKPDHTPTEQFLMGVLILGVIGLVPLAGGLVIAIANLVGFGALVTWLINKQQARTAS